MTSSPTVWRRWLAHELLRLRREARLERSDVAAKIRCTPQKIGHIETAAVPPKVRDLEEILLPLYNVPKDRWAYYLQAARDARKSGWWQSFDDALPDWFSLYVGLEQGATEISNWDSQLIPGLLQTEGYAAAVLRGGTTELDDTEVGRRVELRVARQRALDADPPLRMHVIIAEAALRAGVGGPRVMRDQRARLIQASERESITVQVVEGHVGAHPGLHGPFAILEFATSGDDGVVYLENRTGALYLERSGELDEYHRAFDRLGAIALSARASQDLIVKIDKE